MRSLNKHLPPSSTLSQLCIFCPSSTRRQGREAMVRSSQVVPAATQGKESFPYSSVGSLLQESASHELFQHEPILHPVFLHKLLHCGSLFHRVQSFKDRLLQCGSPISSQVLQGNLFQHGLLSPWLCRSLLGLCSNLDIP